MAFIQENTTVSFVKSKNYQGKLASINPFTIECVTRLRHISAVVKELIRNEKFFMNFVKISYDTI